MAIRLDTSDIEAIQSLSADFLSLIDHDSVETWSATVLGNLKNLLRADRAFLALPVAEGWGMFRSDDDMAAAQAAYTEHYYRLDYHLRIRRKQLRLRAFTHNQVITPSEMRRSEMWNDWLEGYSLRNPAGIAIDVEGVPVPASAVVYQQGAGKGGFGERGRALLELLTPAFEHTVRTMLEVRARAQGLMDFVDDIPVPIALVDGDGAMMHANPGFKSELAVHGDRLRRVAGDLALEILSRADGFRRKSISSHLAATTELPTEGPRPAATLTAHPAHRTVGVRSAIVLVRKSGAFSRMTVDDVDRRFHLTDRESEVALLLARRLTNAEVAACLGISPHTTRRHTERVLRKLGVGSRRNVAKVLSGQHEVGDSGGT